MDKPKRTTGGGFEAPDFDYVSQMLEWYQKTGNDIDLKDFSYSEIQVDGELYNHYINQSPEIYLRHYLPYETDLKQKAVHNLGNDMYTFRIEDSIHFRAITTGCFCEYDEYLKKSNQSEHTVGKFIDLIYNFDLNKMKPIMIMYHKKEGIYTIADGCHRSSILASRGIDFKRYTKEIRKHKQQKRESN